MHMNNENVDIRRHHVSVRSAQELFCCVYHNQGERIFVSNICTPFPQKRGCSFPSRAYRPQNLSCASDRSLISWNLQDSFLNQKAFVLIRILFNTLDILFTFCNRFVCLSFTENAAPWKCEESTVLLRQLHFWSIIKIKPIKCNYSNWRR